MSNARRIAAYWMLSSDTDKPKSLDYPKRQKVWAEAPAYSDSIIGGFRLLTMFVFDVSRKLRFDGLATLNLEQIIAVAKVQIPHTRTVGHLRTRLVEGRVEKPGAISNPQAIGFRSD